MNLEQMMKRQERHNTAVEGWIADFNRKLEAMAQLPTHMLSIREDIDHDCLMLEDLRKEVKRLRI